MAELVLLACLSVALLAGLWRLSPRRFVLVAPALALALAAGVALSPPRRMAQIPEDQLVAKAKAPRARAAAVALRLRPPQKYADRGRQREYERVWYAVAEEIGPPADVKCSPVPASVSLGVRTPPAWR